MVAILKVTAGNDHGKSNWVCCNVVKIFLAVLYSRVLDVMLLAWVGKAGQTALTMEQDRFCKTIKFIIILAAFAIATYEHVFRRNITENFKLSSEERAKI